MIGDSIQVPCYNGVEGMFELGEGAWSYEGCSVHHVHGVPEFGEPQFNLRGFPCIQVAGVVVAELDLFSEIFVAIRCGNLVGMLCVVPFVGEV